MQSDLEIYVTNPIRPKKHDAKEDVPQVFYLEFGMCAPQSDASVECAIHITLDSTVDMNDPSLRLGDYSIVFLA